MTGRIPIDLKFWALVSGVVFVGLIGVDLTFWTDDSPGSLRAQLRSYVAGHSRTSTVLTAVATKGLAYGVVAVFVGWAVHAVVVACGWRLTRDPIGPPHIDHLEPDEIGVGPDEPWDERLAHIVALKRRGELANRGRQGRENR